MKPAQQSEDNSSRTIAQVSAPGFASKSGTTRAALERGERRPRPATSTRPESRRSLALPMQPLPDDETDSEQRGAGDEPRDEAFGNRPDIPERPAAAVVGMLRVLDVADDRVELAVADRLRRERRHHVRADADGFGDLRRGRVTERRWYGV